MEQNIVSAIPMRRLLLLLIAGVASMPAVAAEFDDAFTGAFVGIEAGAGRVKLTGDADATGRRSGIYGVDFGYNWALGQGAVILGLEAYYNKNRQKSTNATLSDGSVTPLTLGASLYGLDIKLGIPAGRWMPYLRLGGGKLSSEGVESFKYKATNIHAGLGLEYKLADHWSLGGEYAASRGKSTDISGQSYKLTDDALKLQLRYYLKNAQPAPVLPPAPPAPRVVAAPPPAPPPAYQPPPPPPQTCSQSMTLPGTSFEFNRAALNGQGAAALDQFVQTLSQGAYSGVSIIGYTDRLGSDQYNLRLSEDRALTVKSYLARYMPASAIQAEGRGKAEPVTQGRCQQRNRRALIDCLAPDRRVELTAHGACR